MVIEVRGSATPSVAGKRSFELSDDLFNESLLRIKFSREKAPLILPSPDWLGGRLFVVDLRTFEAARDTLCAAVSSLGVAGAEVAVTDGP